MRVAAGAGVGRCGQHVPGLGGVQRIVELGGGGCRVAESGMRGHVLHALAINIDLAPVAQGFQELRSGKGALFAFENGFWTIRHRLVRFCAQEGAIIAARATGAYRPLGDSRPHDGGPGTPQKSPPFGQNEVAARPLWRRNGLRALAPLPLGPVRDKASEFSAPQPPGAASPSRAICPSEKARNSRNYRKAGPCAGRSFFATGSDPSPIAIVLNAISEARGLIPFPNLCGCRCAGLF